MSLQCMHPFHPNKFRMVRMAIEVQRANYTKDCSKNTHSRPSKRLFSSIKSGAQSIGNSQEPSWAEPRHNLIWDTAEHTYLELLDIIVGGINKQSTSLGPNCFISYKFT